MSTMNVSLTETLKSWVQQQVETGLYANHSDYIRDLIRKDQEARQEKNWLVNELVKGEESGISSRTLQEIFFAAKEKARR